MWSSTVRGHPVKAHILTVCTFVNVLTIIYIDSTRFARIPNAAVSGAAMFYRASSASVDECVTECMNTQTAPDWKCASFTYDNHWRLCDLYAVVANTGGSSLVNFPGRDYFRFGISTFSQSLLLLEL